MATSSLSSGVVLGMSTILENQQGASASEDEQNDVFVDYCMANGLEDVLAAARVVS